MKYQPISEVVNTYGHVACMNIYQFNRLDYIRTLVSGRMNLYASGGSPFTPEALPNESVVPVELCNVALALLAYLACTVKQTRENCMFIFRTVVWPMPRMSSENPGMVSFLTAWENSATRRTRTKPGRWVRSTLQELGLPFNDAIVEYIVGLANTMDRIGPGNVEYYKEASKVVDLVKEFALELETQQELSAIFPGKPEFYLCRIGVDTLEADAPLQEIAMEGKNLAEACRDMCPSCMTDEDLPSNPHPWDVYDHEYGWRMLVRTPAARDFFGYEEPIYAAQERKDALDAGEDVFAARALVNVDSKKWVRIYGPKVNNRDTYASGNCKFLREWLKANGYTATDGWRGERIAFLDAGDGIVAPYVDGNCRNVSTSKGRRNGFMIFGDEGAYSSCDSTGGYVDRDDDDDDDDNDDEDELIVTRYGEPIPPESARHHFLGGFVRFDEAMYFQYQTRRWTEDFTLVGGSARCGHYTNRDIAEGDICIIDGQPMLRSDLVDLRSVDLTTGMIGDEPNLVPYWDVFRIQDVSPEDLLGFVFKPRGLVGYCIRRSDITEENGFMFEHSEHGYPMFRIRDKHFRYLRHTNQDRTIVFEPCTAAEYADVLPKTERPQHPPITPVYNLQEINF